MKSRVTSRLAVSGALALALSGGLNAAVAPSAEAAVSAAHGRQVVGIAATKKGAPYRYGATGPNSFDCSGYTRWAYARTGKSLPRTADAQYRASIKISRSQARPGDLVFFGGSSKYHVGIYAGNGKMWHAPRRGSSVHLANIWSGASYGRVR